MPGKARCGYQPLTRQGIFFCVISFSYSYSLWLQFASGSYSKFDCSKEEPNNILPEL
jgi:hypothetical protein